MSKIRAPRLRAKAFCERFGLRLPILLAPMAGACPPSLSIAVANADGLGACGALLMPPKDILEWAAEVRGGSNGAFQLNLWAPDPPPERNSVREEEIRRFLAQWGPEVGIEAGNATPPDFGAQCQALLEAAPPIASSIMGLYPPEYVSRLKAHGIAWFANASTVAEARAAEAAGADVVVAQGMEAGGHRGSFDAARAEREMVGLFALCACCRRRREYSGRRRRRRRRWARRRSGVAAWSKRGRDRYRLLAVPGGKDTSGLGRGARGHAAGRHGREPGLQRTGWAQHCDRLCEGRHWPGTRPRPLLIRCSED